jgi:hypothetical protein
LKQISQVIEHAVGCVYLRNRNFFCFFGNLFVSEELNVTYALEGDASINVGTQVAERAARLVPSARGQIIKEAVALQKQNPGKHTTFLFLRTFILKNKEAKHLTPC